MKQQEEVSVPRELWELARLALDVARDYRFRREKPARAGLSVAAERRYRRFCRLDAKLASEARALGERQKLRRVK